MVKAKGRLSGRPLHTPGRVRRLDTPPGVIPIFLKDKGLSFQVMLGPVSPAFTEVSL